MQYVAALLRAYQALNNFWGGRPVEWTPKRAEKKRINGIRHFCRIPFVFHDNRFAGEACNLLFKL
jgi:hypothetical protein